MSEIKADLHNHWRTSSRFYNGDFNRIVDTAQQKLGKGAIIGFINFSDRRYEGLIQQKGYDRESVGDAEQAIYIPSRQVLIVKGQEVPTKQGHLSVLGIGAGICIKEGRTLEETLREVKDFGGIAIADHPFYFEGLGRYLTTSPHLYEQLDAIEIHNGEAGFGFRFGPLPIDANEQAIKAYLANKKDYPNLGALSVSDGHSSRELGSSWTMLNYPQLTNTKEFVESLRKSIRQTNELTESKRTNSIFGAIEHIAKVIAITKIGFNIGLREFYTGQK